MTTAEAITAGSSTSPLEAFNGSIRRPKTGFLYQAGLAIVAFAMVLLPLVYLGLIALTAWGVFLHLMRDTWILEGTAGRGGLVRLILYLGPAAIGGILVVFMVKPFFAAKPKALDPIALDPATEPLLFAFVRRICQLVGAREPCRIDVDCQVNASASLRRGFWSQDLILTVGLPLVAGLDMRQFAGVLAHEFGHFAQGVGLRLTYIIRHINYWFARVVYERDAWDVRLDQAARNTDWRIAIILHAARGCVWLTRRILWALMQAGHAISCFMLRQMEYDADSYEAKLVGSEVFESTASRLRILSIATQMAYEDVRLSWESKRLPADLPLLIDHKATSMSGEVHQKLSAATAAETTGWLDTHPCDNDRNRSVRLLNETGIFQLTAPASHLFADFAALSKTVTRHQYEKHLELDFSEQNLMSTQETLRESAASAAADTMVKKYYGLVNLSLLPLFGPDEFSPLRDDETVATWIAAREATESMRPDAEKTSADCVEQHRRLVTLHSAWVLTKAGFRLEPKEFGLPEQAASSGEQELAAKKQISDTSALLGDQLSKLKPFITALSQRVRLAILLHRTACPRASEPDASERSALVNLAAAVGAEIPRVYDLSIKLRALSLLGQNRDGHSNPAEVGNAMSQLAAELRNSISGIQERLKVHPYPFSHARGPLSVAEYARSETPAENEWHRAYLESDAHIDRLFALNYRLIGTILGLANAAEQTLQPDVE
jgi:Zn-dependent protease with chaperone function